MTIGIGNIKLLASQVMLDVDNGGGQATATEIVDGASNAVFPDISELDRAYGRVNLRKTFVSIDTPDTDGYMGANVIIADPPADSKVSCALFSTADGFDTRLAAKNRLEAYVTAGPLSSMHLYGSQNIGQRAVTIYQKQEYAIPQIGDVFAISQESTSGTTVTVSAQQFVKVTGVASTINTFDDSSGSFVYRVITLTISDSLASTFIGYEPYRITALIPTSGALVRTTTVTDSSSYYGIAALSETAAIGDLKVKATSIYTPLVPSSTLETPIALGTITGADQVIAAGAPVTEPNTIWSGSFRTLYLPGGITPLSLTLSTGSSSGYWPKTDDGKGNLVTPSGAVVGAIDYANGVITPDLAQTAAWTGSMPTVAYTPGAKVSQSSFTTSIAISLATRGQVYVQTLSPIPAPGTLQVSFLALGTWYTLSDNGAGVLSGDATADGTGSINYSTGSAVITLGALPDVGSAVMLAWGSAVDTRVRTSGASGFRSTIALAHGSCTGSSVTVHLTKGGVAKTLTDSGTGVLSGGGVTGTVNYLTGVVVINDVHDAGTTVEVLYNYGSVSGTPTLTTDTFSSLTPNFDGTYDVTVSAHPLAPHTVKMSWPVSGVSSYGAPVASTVKVSDDGSGNLKTDVGGVTLGTINYTSGAIHIQPNTTLNFPIAVLSNPAGGFAYENATVESIAFAALAGVTLTAQYQSTASTASTSAADETFSPTLDFTLSPGTFETVLPGGLVFDLGSHVLVDRSGTIYEDPSFITGGGTAAGTIDYTTSIVSLSNWPASPTLAVTACLTVLGGRAATQAAFRTAGAPVRVSSVYVQASDVDGTLLTGTSDTSGVITGSKMAGSINYQTGVIAINFGHLVTAAGHESEWWYDAARVTSGGQIWKPEQVLPGTIAYNAVVTSTLPLDASIIGLDPVRLPSDGRVPIFRSGNVVVVHNTTTTGLMTVTNGQTVDLGRNRLARVRVFKADGVTLITAGYTANLDAGTVTITSTSTFGGQIKIEHRVEDMALVSDAQLDGTLSLTRQLTHDFGTGSYVSSALVIGDMTSRVPIVFDQATWSGVFSDTLSGSAATASFNSVLAPILVTNEGALTERWAVQFTNTTAFNVIGEHVGVIATGNTSTTCAPNNPMTGAPYFTLTATGWGSGWAAGNVLRFNTVGALYPVWIARTIQQGSPSDTSDSFTVLIRGDIDTP